MTKIVINDVLSTYDVTAVNSNFDKIADALNNKVLYRDPGTGEPNSMSAPLDMNGQKIINVPAPVLPTDLVRKMDIGAISGSVGPQGPQGIQGVPGPTGATGPQGPAGSGSGGAAIGTLPVVATLSNANTDTVATVVNGSDSRVTWQHIIEALGTSASNLTTAGTLTDSDYTVISQAGVDVKVTLGTLKSYFGIPQSAATAITFSGPTSGAVSVASTNYTVGANGVITGTIVVTPSDGGAGGSFSPTSRSISSSSTTGTFTYTPSSVGTKTLSVTNNGSLTNPSSISYVVSASAATAVTMSGPTSGVVSVQSTNFTIAANGAITGTVLVTPSDNSGGGVFSPTSVSVSSGTPSATFKYTPSSTAGSRVISVTNNGGLTNPANITYVTSAVAMPPYELRTTDAGGNKINGISYFPDSTSPNKTMAGTSPNYYTKDAGTAISVRKADGTNAPNPIHFVWSKSSTVCPIAYTDTQLPANSVNGNSAAWTDAVGGANLIYGDTFIIDCYLRGTPGTYYLWVLTSDGFVGVYDNGRGTPIGWTVNS